jgi:hypothetical protein
MHKYWDSRKHQIYYQALFQMAAVVGKQANSVIDVGSTTGFLNWLHWIDERVQVDLGPFPERYRGIKQIQADFMSSDVPELKRRYDLCICSQVLEHIENPQPFCAKLLSIADSLIVSVPYKWREGRVTGHIHDPVDEEKVLMWMGRKPNHSIVLQEPFGPKRMICWYDPVRGPAFKIEGGFAKEVKRDKWESLFCGE